MTTATTVRITEKDEAEKREAKTLAEKLRKHYREGSDNPGSASAKFLRFLFVFQAVTQLYVTLNYLVPFVFGEWNPWFQYYLKVLACYLCVMGLANWLCIILTSCAYTPSKDRPSPDLKPTWDAAPDTFHERTSNNHCYQNGSQTVLDVSEKGGLPWTYCEKCHMHIPPRAHHCKYCKKCILRRDHHCHMVGVCIGHYNQRYFVVLATYGILVGYVGAYMTITYLRYHHQEADSYWIYFAPCTFWKLVTGAIPPLTALLTLHAYLLCIFGPICNIYALSQFSVIASGKTLHELAKKKRIKVTSSVDKNFRIVFGDYWGLNFLFPAQIVFKQTHDGIHYDEVKLGVQDPQQFLKDKPEKVVSRY